MGGGELSPPLSHHEALARVLALAPPVRVDQVPVGAAHGRVLAEALVALGTHPPADVSAMDGYAVAGPPPWTLSGEVAAGGPPAGPLAPGGCARIFTGALMPPGAEAVLIQEDAHVKGARVMPGPGAAAPAAGVHVRRAGQDFARGALLLPAGRRLDARGVGLAAASGHGRLRVAMRPRVAVLALGDELLPPGAAPAPGQIHSSNGAMLTALAAAAGAEPVDLGLVPDRLGALTDALRAAAAHAEIVVTSGGASVGDHDLVRPALRAAGGETALWRIAVRPGKPLVAGRLGAAAFLGLPGNPVSAWLTARLFLLPLVARAMGQSVDPLATRPAVAGADLPAEGPRRHFLRVRLEAATDGLPRVVPLPSQDSARLALLAQADALMVREAGAPPAPQGTPVRLLAPWPWVEGA